MTDPNLPPGNVLAGMFALTAVAACTAIALRGLRRDIAIDERTRARLVTPAKGP